MPKNSPFENRDEGKVADSTSERLEKDRLTRRAALAKIGIRAGAATFALFNVEELARIVLNRMKENDDLRGVAEKVGREFENSGIAYAVDEVCSHCCRQLCQDADSCAAAYIACVDAPNSNQSVCAAQFRTCENNYEYDFTQCFQAHCPSNHDCPSCAL